jgi:hypothetical protein
MITMSAVTHVQSPAHVGAIISIAVNGRGLQIADALGAALFFYLDAMKGSGGDAGTA